jgi:hypothetical protein
MIGNKAKRSPLRSFLELCPMSTERVPVEAQWNTRNEPRLVGLRSIAASGRLEHLDLEHDRPIDRNAVLGEQM